MSSAAVPASRPCLGNAIAPLVVLLTWPAPLFAQQPPPEPGEWKHLTIEELLDIDVTTATRRPDAIRTMAAPVQVLTREDLLRAGIRYLAEAFRLADGLYVGRFDGRTWVVNARGLAINGANKMQVMIDGRSIYSPLYSGIFWDAQDLLIDDIDRIEIIRGPGASLWGANAVHGIVNIITRRAIDTQGALLTIGTGTEERAIVGMRYGDGVGERGSYRIYATYGYRDAQSLASGESARDPLRRGQMGGRYDWIDSAGDEVTVQGDAYIGRIGLLAAPDTPISGGNLLARWTRRGGYGTSQVQAYYDRVERHVPGQFGERRNTVDLDLQHNFPAGRRHAVVAGGGYNVSSDDTDVSPIIFFDPQRRRTYLTNFFAQDEIFLGRGVYGTAGTRLEHNSFSGWELQPTGRVRWTGSRNTLWGAVSRAVRMPTRFDSDIRVPLGQPTVVITGSPDFRSEKMVAYEAGYRAQVADRVALEVAGYNNRYDDLRSQDLRPGMPITLANSVEGHISGIEVGATWTPSTVARLHGSYTYLHRAIRSEPGSADITGGEGNDAPHLATIQLFSDLRPGLRLNVIGRYVAELPRPRVPAYAEADVVVQWDARSWAEIKVVGQNLLHRRHPEFSSGQANLEEYDRGVYLALTIRRR